MKRPLILDVLEFRWWEWIYVLAITTMSPGLAVFAGCIIVADAIVKRGGTMSKEGDAIRNLHRAGAPAYAACCEGMATLADLLAEVRDRLPQPDETVPMTIGPNMRASSIRRERDRQVAKWIRESSNREWHEKGKREQHYYLWIADRIERGEVDQ